MVRYWFDGQLVIEHANVLLRTGAHPNMKFNQLLIAPYIGDGSPVDQTMWVDNLTVATGGGGPEKKAPERRRSESNRRIEVLQTSALPLGYGARGKRKLASRYVFGKASNSEPTNWSSGGGNNGGTTQRKPGAPSYQNNHS